MAYAHSPFISLLAAEGTYLFLPHFTSLFMFFSSSSFVSFPVSLFFSLGLLMPSSIVYLIDGLLRYPFNDAIFGLGRWKGNGKCIAMAPVGTQKTRAEFGRMVHWSGWLGRFRCQ